MSDEKQLNPTASEAAVGNRPIADDLRYDAVVVGAGPNGLSAAIELAHAGARVVVFERAESIGGGSRSAELTLPGFVHDVCSAIHPLAAASPFFRHLPLQTHGLSWVDPPAALAHPLDDGTAVVLQRSIAETADSLGIDGRAYTSFISRWVEESDELLSDVLGPLRIPRHPLSLARFGVDAIRSAVSLAKSRFAGPRARALIAGLGAHSMLPLERPPSAAPGLVLAILAHSVGWPFPRGGAQAIPDALAAELMAHRGEIVLNREITSMNQLPDCRATLLDVTPYQLLKIAGPRFSGLYRRHLRRFRYGPGVFKVDWALDGPIPWRAGECLNAGTVHIGGTLEAIAAAEHEVWRGIHPQRPFVLLAQPSLFDSSRAPAGKHVAWAYCHVPSGSIVDMTDRIEAQVERFAPGFKERILARSTRNSMQAQHENPNYFQGDINGGVLDFRQLFTRPAPRLDPYSTPDRSIFICSASTPPGGGVHGLCGYFAAKSAMKRALN